MNILGKVYNHDLDTSKMFETKEAVRKLLIAEYDNLVDAPDELTGIVESTSKCINIYKHLTENFKFLGSQYTDSMLESNLQEATNHISAVLTAKDGYTFLNDAWYTNNCRPLLEKLNTLVKELQIQFVTPTGKGPKMTF